MADDLTIKWKFVNHSEVYYEFCESLEKFYKKICLRYRVNEDDIIIISIKDKNTSQLSLF